ncbi:MAG: glycosyltransferase family 2 protein [Chlorobiaceae bacterium]
MMLSIVTTLYRSLPFLKEYYRRASASAEQVFGIDYELIFVNDGSPDNSLQFVLELQKKDSHVKIVDLSRNFGHHAAIVAGLAQSRGEYVFLIDCDLEEQPEWLKLFQVKMHENDADVVFGIQQERVSTRLSNLFGEIFWSSLNFMSSIHIPHNMMTCRLMTRRYVDALQKMGDRVLFIGGIFAWTGFKQESLSLKKIPRDKTSKSTYTLSRKLLMVADSFSSFSIAPLMLIFFCGLLVWAGSMAYSFFLLIQKLLYPEIILSGYTSLMLSLWVLGSMIILFIGIIGLYLAKIFQEVKRRPLYIVRNIYN